MKNHVITMEKIKAMTEKGISTFSRKNNSPRGCETVFADEIQIGDKILIDNYFHEVIETDK